MAAGYPPFYARHTMHIYEKIVAGKYSSPHYFSKALKHLIGHLLQVDRLQRYGILKDGIKDIKGHEWFKIIDWDALWNKKLKASFKPEITTQTDLRNFTDFDEEPLRTNTINEYAKDFAEITI